MPRSAREARGGLGPMIATARAAPAPIEKHGRSRVAAITMQQYERLTGSTDVEATQSDNRSGEESA